jgi:hypothetical protein
LDRRGDLDDAERIRWRRAFIPTCALIFTLPGRDYALGSTAAAIGAVLLPQTVGFLPGFVDYYLNWRQIGPPLHGRASQRIMELAIGSLFLILCVATLSVALKKFEVFRVAGQLSMRTFSGGRLQRTYDE